jgi:hypothetical protein
VFDDGKPFQPSLMYVGKPKSLLYSGAPGRYFTRVGCGLTRNHLIRLERLARDMHSSLLLKVVTYGRKKFHNIGHRWHNSDVSLLLDDVILAQLACPLNGIIVCLHQWPVL